MIDLRPWLPREPENDPTPSHFPKSGMTIHYQGVDVARDMSDAEAQVLIESDALFHIRKEWAPGVYGGGLMYAIVIAPSGTTYQTRDLDAVLWHAGDAQGNSDTTPVLVLAGPNTPPTPAQYRSLGSVLMGQTTYPHSYWSATSCPGDALRQWLEYGTPEDDMDEETVKRLVREVLTEDGYPNFVTDVGTRLAKDAHHTHETGEPIEKA